MSGLAPLQWKGDAQESLREKRLGPRVDAFAVPGIAEVVCIPVLLADVTRSLELDDAQVEAVVRLGSRRPGGERENKVESAPAAKRQVARPH